MDKEKLKQYKNQFDKDNYKQFKAKLKPNESDEINQFLEKNNMTKRELVLKGKEMIERRNNMKINDLYEINILNTKAGILVNHHIDEEFYDYYFENEISWLIENKNKIENDFSKNIDKFKFDIILNTKLDERIALILSLKKASIEEFSNYINYIPFATLDKNSKSQVTKYFEEFKSIKDDHDTISFFDRICRRWYAWSGTI